MRRGCPALPARLITLGTAVFALVLAAGPAPAQEVPFTAPPLPDDGGDVPLRLRTTTVRLVWRHHDPQMLHIRRTIASIEAQAGEAVQRLESHRHAQPARTSLAQGEVLDDAWAVISRAELVGVPAHVERPLRRAVSARIAPLRCAAIARYFEAARLSDGSSSIRVIALDHLHVHGRSVVHGCTAGDGPIR